MKKSLRSLFALLVLIAPAAPVFSQVDIDLPDLPNPVREDMHRYFNSRFGGAQKPPEASDTQGPGQQIQGRQQRPDLDVIKQLKAAGFNDEQMERIWAISALIRTTYVDDVDSKKLLYGALKGMFGQLDSHSDFYDPEEYKALQQNLESSVAGVGVIFGKKEKDHGITVLAPIPGGPAKAAGIKAGDVILSIDGASTLPMDPEKIVSLIHGEPGTNVTLVIRRVEGGAARELTVPLKRAEVSVPVVFSTVLPGGAGYLQLSEFTVASPMHVFRALALLKSQGARSYIIDLRNNPGGSLDSAVKIASLFLPKDKVIVTTQGRAVAAQGWQTGSDGLYSTEPLAVLVNGMSASASEIFAAAVQDNKRGTIVGSKSYGKGTVQTVIPFDDGSAVKLTIARYYTPSGRSVDRNGGTGGVTPDVPVTLSEAQEVSTRERLIRQLMGESAAGSDPILDAGLRTVGAPPMAASRSR